MRPFHALSSAFVSRAFKALAGLVGSVVLAVLAAASWPTPEARAAEPIVYTRFDDAVRGWLDDAGYSRRGGYGRYNEDRQAAAAITKAFDAVKSPPARLPLGPPGANGRGGPSWGWVIRGEVKGEAGPCTLATAQMAMNAWRWFAERGVVDRPVVVEVKCSWVTVTATFRAPDRPGPSSGRAAGCDVLHVVQVDPSNGIVTQDDAALFGLPAKTLVVPPKEGEPRGERLERSLLEQGTWARAAKGQAAALGGYDAARGALDASDTACIEAPALDDGLLCGGFVATTRAETCAGAGLLLLTRELDARAAAGNDPAKLGARVAVSCRSGHQARLALTDGEVTVALYQPPSMDPISSATLRLELPRVTSASPGPRARAESPRGGGKLARFARLMPTVARLAGGTRAELDALAKGPLAAALESLVVTCDPAQSGEDGVRPCRAATAAPTPRATCEALAWGLAASAPHRAKPPFGRGEAVDLTLTCGAEAGAADAAALTTVAKRRAIKAGAHLEIELASSFAGSGACEALGFDVVCDTEPRPASVPLRLAAPTAP